MSFIVSCTIPIDDDWEKTELELFKAAGRKNDTSVASYEKGKPASRMYLWYVSTMREASAYKRELRKVPKTTVAVREK